METIRLWLLSASDETLNEQSAAMATCSYCCNQGYSAHNCMKSLCKLHQILFDHLKLQQQLPWECITAVYIYMRNLRICCAVFSPYLCTYKASNLEILHSLDLPPNFKFYIEKHTSSICFETFSLLPIKSQIFVKIYIQRYITAWLKRSQNIETILNP